MNLLMEIIRLAKYFLDPVISLQKKAYLKRDVIKNLFITNYSKYSMNKSPDCYNVNVIT